MRCAPLILLVGTSLLLAGCGSGTVSTPDDVILASPPPPAPVLSWLTNGGGEGVTYGTGGATCPDGCAVVTGEFEGVASFGEEDGANETLVAGGPHDVFIAHYDPAGALLWARACIGTDVCAVSDVAVGPDGQVTAVGYFFDSITFDGADESSTTLTAPVAGWDDGFVARFDETGRLLWVEHVSSDSIEEVIGVVARDDGSVVVAGIYCEPLTLGAGPDAVELVPTGWWEGFLAAYAADGALLWARTTSSLPEQGATMWTLDAFEDGSIAVAGDFEGTTTIGTQTLSSVEGSQDSWIARFSAQGDFQWARSLGGAHREQVFGIGACADGTLRLAGDFIEESTFGQLDGEPLSLTSLGGADGFVASYGATGAVQWVEQIGGSGSDYIYDVCIAPDGSMHVIGYFSGSARIGVGQLTEVTLESGGEGDRDVFFAGFGSDGSFGWARRFGGPEDDFGAGLCGFADGSYLIMGSFQGEATLGDHDTPDATVCACGDRDAFIGRMQVGRRE